MLYAGPCLFLVFIGDIGRCTEVGNSSDVISDMRVNVSEQGSERVVWYKASICVIFPVKYID